MTHVVILNWRDPWHPEGGGSELYVHEVARRLHAQGREVTWVTASYPEAAKRETVDGVRFLRRGGRFSVYLWTAWLLLSHRLASALKATSLHRLGRVDSVLEVQNGMPFLAAWTSRAPVTALVHHVHREQWSIVGPTLARVGWFFESRVAIRAARRCPYVTVADATRRELVELGVDATRITLAYNGVPQPPATVSDLKAEEPTIVVLSRLVPHKQIEHAIRAIRDLAPEFPGVRLRVLGDGWWAPSLLEEVERCGVADRVEFLGFVDERTKFAELARAWVHLLPSVKEGWGLSIVEAARVGTPSVAYATAGGVTEAILDCVTGLLAQDERDLVAQVATLLRNPDLRAQMGEKARVRSEEFTWDATATTIAAVIEER